jgi:hypothetical protein
MANKLASRVRDFLLAFFFSFLLFLSCIFIIA